MRSFAFPLLPTLLLGLRAAANPVDASDPELATTSGSGSGSGSSGGGCPSTSKADFDFIVVGAGNGGGLVAARLAEANFKVLLVEAGQNTANINTTMPGYFGSAFEDPAVSLNYTIHEYPKGFKYARDNWYPRGQNLGGSTMINAMIDVTAGTTEDWAQIGKWSGDKSWNRFDMQRYYDKITSDFLKTSGLPLDVINKKPHLLDDQLRDTFATLQVTGNLTSRADPMFATESIINLPQNDKLAGFSTVRFTIDADHARSSIHERLQDLERARKIRMAYGTIATKVLTCKRGSKPKAYGVQVAHNSALAVAAQFTGKKALKLTEYTAKYEVIVSAGVFQSPQLLMLSGIGDRAQLAKVNIPSVVHLPGVGRNMQDHDEVSVIWQFKKQFVASIGCIYGQDPATDPCLKEWLADHSNFYSFSPTVGVHVATSPNRPKLTQPDMLTYFELFHFIGIFRGFRDLGAANPKGFTAVSLKGHSASRGTVTLTGSHPQDPLNIQKNHFQVAEAQRDLVDLREGIKRSRRVFDTSPLAKHIFNEQVPGPDVNTDAEIDDYIYKRVFGHHACCTNAMGPKSDPDSVIDTDFKVIGIDGLRVVDMSSWHNVPGFFVITTMYMLAERAVEAILRDV